MFANTDSFGCFLSEASDPFNRLNCRNVSNTKKDTYNCAGYALETFSWYCPYDGMYDCEEWAFASEYRMSEWTVKCVHKMLEDFPTLRVIDRTDDAHDNETVIVFRLSSDGDFHYIKRGKNHLWYHKCGGSEEINIMPEKEVFSKEWIFRYDGPLVLLAKA